MLLVPQRLERSHGRMQPKEAVKINHTLLSVARTRNSNAGTHAVISLLTVRHHDVQSVGGAALEQDDQALLPRRCGFSGINRSRQKAGNNAGANNGQRAILQKNSASDRHILLLKSSPRTRKIARIAATAKNYKIGYCQEFIFGDRWQFWHFLAIVQF